MIIITFRPLYLLGKWTCWVSELVSTLKDGLCSRFHSIPDFPVVLCVALSVYGLKFRKYVTIFLQLGTAVAQWLKCCATNRKFAVSIPDGVFGIFHWHNPSDRTLSLGVDSASNINEYQEHFLGVKAAGAWGWQSYRHPVPLSCNLGTLTSWNHLGHSRPVTGLLISGARVILSRINSQIISLVTLRSFYLLFIYWEIVSSIGIISAGLDS